MRIPRIFTAQALAGGSALSLEPEPSHHLARVLRMGVGDALVLFDGTGGEYPATITALGRKHVEVQTGEPRTGDNESPLHVHLGIALSRGDRMDWVVQKATELGVGAITPLFSEHTGVKLAGERAEKKIKHWRQVAVSACEQCGRNRLPDIHPPRPLDDWLASVQADRKFVLHHRATGSEEGEASTPASIALLVGPEGGLSDGEIAGAERAGFTALRLGPRVLRTETAPIAALAILQARWGDMQS